MNLVVHTDPRRPEAMADVPGGCELPLTRAVVHYRDMHEIELSGGRIQDVGLALVLEGRYASSAQVIELGSGEVKHLDLSAELVVLDWVYEPTAEHVQTLLTAAAAESEGLFRDQSHTDLNQYCFDLALRVLSRAGFGPLTRPSLLRIGFRDICRDLDLHEGTSVRLLVDRSRVVRIRMDYDSASLVVCTGSSERDHLLEEALAGAFPGQDMRLRVASGSPSEAGYLVRFPLPQSLSEARGLLEAIRMGLSHLLARFETERYRGVEGITRTFGTRETLARLNMKEPRVHTEPLRTHQLASVLVH